MASLVILTMILPERRSSSSFGGIGPFFCDPFDRPEERSEERLFERSDDRPEFRSEERPDDDRSDDERPRRPPLDWSSPFDVSEADESSLLDERPPCERRRLPDSLPAASFSSDASSEERLPRRLRPLDSAPLESSEDERERPRRERDEVSSDVSEESSVSASTVFASAERPPRERRLRPEDAGSSSESSSEGSGLRRDRDGLEADEVRSSVAGRRLPLAADSSSRSSSVAVDGLAGRRLRPVGDTSPGRWPSSSAFSSASASGASFFRRDRFGFGVSSVSSAAGVSAAGSGSADASAFLRRERLGFGVSSASCGSASGESVSGASASGVESGASSAVSPSVPDASELRPFPPRRRRRRFFFFEGASSPASAVSSPSPDSETWASSVASAFLPRRRDEGLAGASSAGVSSTSAVGVSSTSAVGASSTTAASSSSSGSGARRRVGRRAGELRSITPGRRRRPCSSCSSSSSERPRPRPRRLRPRPRERRRLRLLVDDSGSAASTSRASSTSGSSSSSATRFAGASDSTGSFRPGTSSPASASNWGRLSVRSEKWRKQSCFWPTSTKAARMAGITFWI